MHLLFQNQSIAMHILIPDEYSPFIIGKRGRTISSMHVVSSTNVCIGERNSRFSPLPRHKFIAIFYCSPSVIKQAKILVMNKIHFARQCLVKRGQERLL